MPWHFYVVTLFQIAFIVLPGVIGSWLAIHLARYLDRRSFQIAVVITALALLAFVTFWWKAQPATDDLLESACSMCSIICWSDRGGTSVSAELRLSRACCNGPTARWRARSSLHGPVGYVACLVSWRSRLGNSFTTRRRRCRPRRASPPDGFAPPDGPGRR